MADFRLAVTAQNGSEEAAVGGGGGGCSDSQWGALAYLAPEMPLSGPSKKSDVYSYGCVLYHMCTGKQPFQVERGRRRGGRGAGAVVWLHLWRRGGRKG